MIASVQPYHCIDDGRWAERRIGHQRALTTYAFRSLLDAGATLAFGSDWFVAPINPLVGIYAATTRRTLDGKNPDGWIPEQKLTVAAGCPCLHGGLGLCRKPGRSEGSIEPGKLADFAVLSDDIFHMDPVQIENVHVEMTVSGGEIVYERRQVRVSDRAMLWEEAGCLCGRAGGPHPNRMRSN